MHRPNGRARYFVACVDAARQLGSVGLLPTRRRHSHTFTPGAAASGGSIGIASNARGVLSMAGVIDRARHRVVDYSVWFRLPHTLLHVWHLHVQVLVELRHAILQPFDLLVLVRVRCRLEWREGRWVIQYLALVL